MKSYSCTLPLVSKLNGANHLNVFVVLFRIRPNSQKLVLSQTCRISIKLRSNYLGLNSKVFFKKYIKFTVIFNKLRNGKCLQFSAVISVVTFPANQQKSYLLFYITINRKQCRYNYKLFALKIQFGELPSERNMLSTLLRSISLGLGLHSNQYLLPITLQLSMDF